MNQVTWKDLNYIKPLNEDEEIILVTREHWIIPAIKVFLNGFIIFILLVVTWILNTFVKSQIAIELANILVYTIICWQIIFLAIYFHNYYLSAQIITNERIIDVDQKGLFKKETNDAFFENVEGINMKQNTFWQNLLNYGSVDVQTAGTSTELAAAGSVFENVPNPRRVIEVLNNVQHQVIQMSRENPRR